ncbi:MAG: glycoside hydrolase family 97 protein [Flavobacteriaceae bacterium]|nr:glycoside hydrolase family 97 protein [Flavobacteriaceae bacterium]
MLKRLSLVLLLTLSISCTQQEKKSSYQVTSPNNKNKITFELTNGIPAYMVAHGDKSVLNKSHLGFVFKGQDSLSHNFDIVKVDTTSFNETWEQVWGEKQFIKNNYRQLAVTLMEKSGAQNRKLEIQFRAFDDGVALRYIFPEQGLKDSLVIMDELTSFNLNDDGDAWWIGAYQDNRYEYLTTKSPVSSLDTVHTPLTIKSHSGLSLSFHEANLKDFASMTLARISGTELKCDLVPWADGDKVKTNGSFTTPWRTLQIAEKPGDLISSYLILNLNDPNKLEDTSWIKPHKYLGIWWGMHIGKYSFWESPIQGATTKNAFEHIDYCNKLGIDHLLIEGWNKGWTPAWYENAMHMFSFTNEADNFDLKKVTDYAKEKGVSIIGYHETGSNIINYLEQIDAGMTLYENMGIHDVKIGQVGSRLNMKEWHHGQFGVNYYRSVLEKAAEHQLTVNFHEPIKDTGERRTYPNMMAREGARGQEYNAWSDGNPPNHTAILPFTRLLSGPMDFTPGVLDVEIKQGFEGRDVHTTAAKQLALYVVLYSPIQMLADLPENYDGHPAFKFLQDVPVDWEDTKVLNAEIGEYITTVRKDKFSDDWYLGSLTNEAGRSFDIDLSFLEADASYEAQIYADAEGITWNKNATEVSLLTKEVRSTDTLQLRLAEGGGTAIRFKKL